MVIPAMCAQSIAQLPDAPGVGRSQPRVEIADASVIDANASTIEPPSAVQEPDAPGMPPQKTTSDEDLKQAERQRVVGIIPAFNAVNGGVSPPLTPRQKFQLMFRSTTDYYVIGFSAFTAGIGQARNSHAAYGQGIEGYAKRFGASYADTADGNFWGNAVLTVLLHEDPRYFRKGTGTIKRRLLYSMETTVVCKRDNGTWGPNYANVLGNFIAGGISNVYYPQADRGVGQTFQSALTVTAEGMIGAALIEFWPDIQDHYRRKKQAKLEAAGHSITNPSPTGKPPQ